MILLKSLECSFLGRIFLFGCAAEIEMKVESRFCDATGVYVLGPHERKNCFNAPCRKFAAQLFRFVQDGTWNSSICALPRRSHSLQTVNAVQLISG